MNEQQIRLIELYLSGQRDDPEVMAAIKNNPHLIEELARDKVAQRLIKHQLSAVSENEFTAQVSARLRQQSATNRPWWAVAVAACLVLVAVVSLTNAILPPQSTQTLVKNTEQNNHQPEPVEHQQKLNASTTNDSSQLAQINNQHTAKTKTDSLIDSEMSLSRFEVVSEGNLLPAEDAYFEQGNMANWQVTDDSVGFAEVRRNAGKTGQYGIYVNTLAGKADLLLSGIMLPESFLKGQTPLRLSFDIKNLSAKENVFGGFSRISHMSNHQYYRSVQGRWFNAHKKSWQKFERLIWVENFPPSHNRLEINFRVAGQEWLLDNIELTHVARYKNLLRGDNAGFESGQETPYLVEKLYPGYESQAFVEVNEAAAIDGRYGLYVDSYPGEMKLKFLHWAFDLSDLPEVETYWLTFDVRVVHGNASFEIRPRGGESLTIPSWPASGFAMTQSQVGDDGLVKVTARVPAELVKRSHFDISVHLKKGAIVHLDNFAFSPIEEE
ncbi:hypothetical protein [Gayadomonas joobiniege]|uniref:hypothetical protein n=1 Tax=Gayadomonas joobiniege TaxID=1234606 RepID=UPI00036A1CC8|nr:hypothetical protein [Gayadomonas joobiniege]